jgi:D-beta-D-heptose 7-phosphate kinase/D-beta-D-heptose 1-phosphate adenosyltransferase
LTNGVFDVFHIGHLQLLKHCRDLAGEDGEVIVLIDDDAKVRQDKGECRPIFHTHERMKMLNEIPGCNGRPLVDVCMYFYSDEQLENMIKNLNADILVKGSDWRDKPIMGANYVKKVEFFDRIDGYSTSEIIDRIKDKWKRQPINHR